MYTLIAAVVLSGVQLILLCLIIGGMRKGSGGGGTSWYYAGNGMPTYGKSYL